MSKVVQMVKKNLMARAGFMVFVLVMVSMSLIACGQEDDSWGKGQGGSSAFETEDGKKKSGAFKMRGVNATGF
jgi:hypothetical protein